MELFFCDDCTLATINEDYSGLLYLDERDIEEKIKNIQAGIEQFKNTILSHCETDVFSKSYCDCCKTKLAGRRTRFVDEIDFDFLHNHELINGGCHEL